MQGEAGIRGTGTTQIALAALPQGRLHHQRHPPLGGRPISAGSAAIVA